MIGVWSFLISIAYFPPALSEATAGRWIVIALGVPLLADVRLIAPRRLQIAVLLGLAWTAGLIAIAPDRPESLLELYQMVLLVCVMAIASQEASLDQAMMGMAWGIAVNLLFCASSYLGHRLVLQGSDAWPGLFFNSEVFAEFAAPVAVWMLVRQRWCWSAIALAPVLINGSRLGIAAIGFAVLCAHWPERRSPRLLVASMGIVAMGIVAIGALVSLLTLDNPDRWVSAMYRLKIWSDAVWLINPMGHGLGWYLVTPRTHENFPHSDVLQALIELGPAALCFAVIPFYALQSRSDHAEWAAFIAVCVELVFSFPLHVPANAFLAAMLAGFLVRDRHRLCLAGSDRRNPARADAWPSDAAAGAAGCCGFVGEVFPVRCAAPALPRVDSNQG